MMFKLITLLIALFSLTLAQDWQVKNGLELHFGNTSLNYDDADKYCKEIGGAIPIAGYVVQFRRMIGYIKQNFKQGNFLKFWAGGNNTISPTFANVFIVVPDGRLLIYLFDKTDDYSVLCIREFQVKPNNAPIVEPIKVQWRDDLVEGFEHHIALETGNSRKAEAYCAKLGADLSCDQHKLKAAGNADKMKAQLNRRAFWVKSEMKNQILMIWGSRLVTATTRPDLDYNIVCERKK